MCIRDRSNTDLAALSANGKIKIWQDGIEIPVTAVPEGAITADTIATMDEDGTMHILISPQVTGTQEAIEAISPLVDEVDKLGVTTAGMWAGIMPSTTMDLIGSAAVSYTHLDVYKRQPYAHCIRQVRNLE